MIIIRFAQKRQLIFNVIIMNYTTAIPSITDFIPTPNPRIGSPFSIQCTATGIPQPDITWRKDGLLLEATEDEVLRIVEINDGRTSSVEVSEGRTEFNGIYECIATNDADSVMKIARIELLGELQYCMHGTYVVVVDMKGEY